MRTRNGRRTVLFAPTTRMIFHEPALGDLDAVALDDEAPNSRQCPCGSSKEGRGACFASASGSEPDGRSGARNGRLEELIGRRRGDRRSASPNVG